MKIKKEFKKIFKIILLIFSIFCITKICVDLYADFGLKWWLRYHLEITDFKVENFEDEISVKYNETARIFSSKATKILNQFSNTFEYQLENSQRKTGNLKSNLIFVTAASANHFEELLRSVGSAQFKFPGHRILVYDLGLWTHQRKTVQMLCNVEDRTFDFGRYPDTVSNLNEYRWKPIIFAVRTCPTEKMQYAHAQRFECTF